MESYRKLSLEWKAKFRGESWIKSFWRFQLYIILIPRHDTAYTLHVMHCTMNQNVQVFVQWFCLVPPIKPKIETILVFSFKITCLGHQKCQVRYQGKPKAKALRHLKSIWSVNWSVENRLSWTLDLDIKSEHF